MDAFTEFAIVISIAAVMGAFFTRLKQPAILGYIICGLLLGILLPSLKVDAHNLEVLSKVGVAFLLFVLGLDLNLKELRGIGKVALVIGIGQIIFTFALGWLFSILLGFSIIAALYIAVGVTFSSTIIIIKLIMQKNQSDSLYAKIVLGFLLVQDFVAILILIGLSATKGLNAGGIETISLNLLLVLLKGVAATTLIFLFVKFIFNKFLDLIRNEKEVLFITVIAWALLMSALMGSSFIGLSIEIGALIAGIALSHRFESLQIESWTKPLRDFFIIIFFVILGLQVNFNSVGNVILPALAISAFILLVKPLIVVVLAGLMKYSSKVGFYMAIAIAQISEFSLIVTKFGYDLGHISDEILTLMTISGGITMTISSLMIFYNDELYKFLGKYLKVFEFKTKAFSDEKVIIEEPKKYDVLLLGCHRMGKRFLNSFTSDKKILVVDFDPRVVKSLKDQNVDVLYGDIADVSMYERYQLETVEMVVSTVPSLKENIKLVEYLKTLRPSPITIIIASDDDQIKELYKAGADIVVYPHLLGSDLIKKVVEEGLDSKSIQELKNKHTEEFLVS